MRRRRKQLISGVPDDRSGGYRDLWTLWMLRQAEYLGVAPSHILHHEQFCRLTGLPEVVEPDAILMEKPALTPSRLTVEGPLTARQARRVIRCRLEELEAGPLPREGIVFRNVRWLGERLGLSPAETELLVYAALCGALGTLDRHLSGDLGTGGVDNETLYRVLESTLDLPAAEIRHALSPREALRDAGLLLLDPGLSGLDDKLKARDDLAGILLERQEGPEALLAHFYREAAPSTLAASAFPHLAADYAIVRDYLAAAIRESRKGVNILLYGPPGVGKTEFGRLLGAEIGARLVEVKCENSVGDALDGSLRFASFRFCQRLFARDSETVILFDEMEDAFPSDAVMGLLSLFGGEAPSGGRGKGWVNRLLESNPVPAIWISNRVRHIDPAYLRRFDFALEFRDPPRSVRRGIVSAHLGPLNVSDALIARIAEQRAVTPAQVEKAARVARAVSGSPEHAERTILRTLENSLRLMGEQHGRLPQPRDTGYSLAFLNTTPDAAALPERLRGAARTSLCFYGPPGTGKTALSRHIAEAIDRPLLARRASDLLSKWLGGTEKLIAEMFDEAADEGAVLLLDEADSFLGDRRDAVRSWEITQVNELLTQIEGFEGIFICTTNLMERLDPASLRRFAFKVRFDYLTADQRWAMFCAELARLGGRSGEIPGGIRERVKRLTTLTPGDFAAVVRQFAITGQPPSAEFMAAALEEECRAKGEKFGGIGFVG